MIDMIIEFHFSFVLLGDFEKIRSTLVGLQGPWEAGSRELWRGVEGETDRRQQHLRPEGDPAGV